jgi:hypothetical protein
MTLESISNYFSTWALSLLLLGTCSTGFAAFLFKKFGTGWIKNYFDTSLEHFKSEKNKELQLLIGEYSRETDKLKAHMNKYVDRAMKLNAKQYEILPEAWGRLSKAYGMVSSVLIDIDNDGDLDQFSDQQLEYFLSVSSLNEQDKSKIRNADNKTVEYAAAKQRLKKIEAKNMCIEFQNYIILNSLFIDQDGLDKMYKANELLRGALIQKGLYDYATSASNGYDNAMKNINVVRDIMEELRQEIRAHLTEVDPREIAS